MGAAGTIVVKSGLVALKEGVASYFAAHGITAAVSLGWSARTKQNNEGDGGANRVVFIPGDESGNAGQLSQPEQPGDREICDATGTVVASVRALRMWSRLVTVSIWACDNSDPSNEDLQIEATDTLFNQTITAVHYALAPTSAPGGAKVQAIGLANVEWGKVRTSVTPVDRSFGRELLADLTYKHPIFGPLTEIAFPGVGTISPNLNSGT